MDQVDLTVQAEPNSSKDRANSSNRVRMDPTEQAEANNSNKDRANSSNRVRMDQMRHQAIVEDSYNKMASKVQMEARTEAKECNKTDQTPLVKVKVSSRVDSRVDSRTKDPRTQPE